MMFKYSPAVGRVGSGRLAGRRKAGAHERDRRTRLDRQPGGEVLKVEATRLETHLKLAAMQDIAVRRPAASAAAIGL